MIDSHCHLAGEEFVADLDAVVARARAAGVVRVPGHPRRRGRRRMDAGQATGRGVAGGAVRDRRAPAPGASVRRRSGRRRRAGREPARQVAAGAGRSARSGSTTTTTSRRADVQQAVFRAQLALARARGLPVVIHTREAEADTLRHHRRGAGARAAGRRVPLLHRGSGGRRRALATGFLLSFAGIVTFPRPSSCGRPSRVVPLDRLLVETDSPVPGADAAPREAQRAGVGRRDAGRRGAGARPAGRTPSSPRCAKTTTGSSPPVARKPHRQKD